jgi:protein-S-isoprenylcysteine O-methyltransferase Ste14
MNSFRWSNVPLPEGHLVALTAGVALQVVLPLKLFERSWLNDALGWPLLALGILLVAWAVVTLGDMDIAKPTSVVTSGPYAFSRNPMYVAWTAIYLAVALLLDSGWLLILLPALLVLTHFLVVRREEQSLEAHFGREYRDYRHRVRRYL